MSTISLAGEDPGTQASLAAVWRFNEAFNRHDLEAVMAAMTADCIFENTYPPPDGTRAEGAEAVRAAFAEFFRASPAAQFEFEEVFAAGARAIARWRYRWQEPGGKTGSIRGVDIFRIREGKVAEKLSYVKG